ncbi:hypothetical protein GOV12_06440 [Candidatus Pacearchaeota archaeon]|nr:hypothetical protein [Candidatus Pacearchaeota archaeon]
MKISEYEALIENELGELTDLIDDSVAYSNAINDLEKIMTCGYEVFQLLNEKLSASELEKIDYYSTEERVVGLLRILNNCELYTPPLDVKGLFDREKSPDGFKVFRIGYSGLLGSEVLESVMVSYPYFHFANEHGVLNDKGFGDSTLHYLRECNDDFKDRFRGKDLESYDSWFKKLVQNIREVDFEYELSPEGYSNGRARENKGIVDGNFPIGMIFDRLKQNGKINDPNYQKLLLIRWLSAVEIKDYHQAIKFMEYEKDRCQKRLEKLRGLNYPLLHDFERRQKALELVSTELSGSEGFVNRFLKN